jgi:adenine-specific DNA-methyltransferase
MKLTDNEKRDIVRLIEEGKNLPEKYRFIIFDQTKQVELNWNGKSDDVTNIDLPFQIIEQVDEPRTEKVKLAQSSFDFNSGRQTAGWTNKLIWGDNKYILSSLKNGPMRNEIEKEGGIKLIYIDPPFDVGADFSMNVTVGEESYEKKPNVLEQLAYRDTWGKGADSFLSMIYERLILAKDLLSDDGTIYVHCDYRLSGAMRQVLTEVFGENSFSNEIIWQGAVGDTSSKNKKFIKSHDTIFVFRKNHNSYIWNDIFQTYSEASLKLYKNEDSNGRYQFVSVDNPGGGGYQYDLGYGEKSPKNGYRMPKDTALKWIKDDILQVLPGTVPRKKSYIAEGVRCKDVWTDIRSTQGNEFIGYPTQKPEKLLERIIKSSSNDGDIVLDFFAGSGTTAAVCEKLGRKWICSDLGKFAIHACRKRMIGIQRNLKKEEKNWRAFEILNLGKYQRQHYIYDGKSERDEIKVAIKKKKEKEFKKLILDAYKAIEINGFKTIHGKKNDSLVSIGPINQPLSRDHVGEVIDECLKNKIMSVDILGFEYEMGLFPTIQEEAKSKGLRLAYKQIPMEVFDKRAISKGEVIFHDVAYIEFKPIFKKKKLSIELTDFAVFYNEDNLSVDENLSPGKSKIIVENGQIIEKEKDKNGIIKENILTKKWYDWIDYWSVDFNYESKPEIIKFKTKDGKIEEEWTGNYIFENEWQSFKGKKDGKLELKSSEKEILSGKTKVAVKVIDIFGNDTMKILQVKI